MKIFTVTNWKDDANGAWCEDKEALIEMVKDFYQEMDERWRRGEKVEMRINNFGYGKMYDNDAGREE